MKTKLTTIPKLREYDPLERYAYERIAILDKIVQKIKTKQKK